MHDVMLCRPPAPWLTSSGRSVPPGAAAPGATLVLARTAAGAPWAVPLTRADPVLLTYGRSVSTNWPAEAGTRGSVHLTDPADRAAAGTTVVHALARPLRLMWGGTAGGPLSHVPGFLLVEENGAVTTVDVGRPGPSLAQAAAAWTVRENGWRSEAYSGPTWDRHGPRLAWTVLRAPVGLASEGLRAAARSRSSGSVLLAAVTTPGDLLVLLSALRTLAAAARRYAVAEGVR